tara:strand:+ start:392 stop:1321 length:930 start_codon:yes stop_codon:yes gene_type:complete
MLLALATCGNLPGWEKDDKTFQAALDSQGIEYEQPVWDDPGVDWSRYDACVIRTTWDYMEKLPGFLDWVDRVGALTSLMNAPSVVRWNSAKTYLRDLEREGVPIAPTLWLEKGRSYDLQSILAEKAWTKAFLKPVVGLCAWETLRFQVDEEGLAEAQAHLERNLAFQSMMLQPYLERVETTGEFSTLFFGGEFSHAVQKVPVPGDYRVQDDFGASDHRIEASEELLRLSQRVLDGVAEIMKRIEAGACMPLVYARIDFLENNEGALVVNEVELIEPSLFFRHDPAHATKLVAHIQSRLSTEEVQGESQE